MRSRPPGRRPSRGLPVVLLLACFAIITLDARGGDDSPIEPARSFAGDVFGPVESGTAAAVRPFTVVPEYFTTHHRLRADLAKARLENAGLRSQLAVASVDRNRVAELDGLLAGARGSGYALVPARVVAMGPAQSFSRTVTIDAGTRSGVHPDMTVLNNDGLVGRVLRADRATATVLLLVDQESVVGGRLGSSMEVGFLRGRGRVAGSARLDLELVDDTADTAAGDPLVSWGSKNGAPYVAGIPIGRVTSVHSTPREQSKQAVIAPFVDFTSLDLVGVVVSEDARSDRGVIAADGTTGGGSR